MKNRSLRVRAIAAALIWIALALGAGSITILKLFQDSMGRQHDVALEAQLDLLASTIALGKVSIEERMTDPSFARVFSGLYWQAGTAGQEPLRSRSLWDFQLDVPESDGAISAVHTVGPDDQHLRLLTRTLLIEDEAWTLAVAGDLAPLDRELARFRRNLLVNGTVSAIALLGLAALLLRSALSPLYQLRRAVLQRNVAGADSFDGSFPSEVQPLVDDLDAMLQRNAQLRERGRVRAANLAHALRTPAAILRNELNKARRGESIDLDIAEQAVERIVGAATRQTILPATANVPHDFPTMQVDAVPILYETVGALRRLFPHIDFEIETPDKFPLPLDIDDQHEILGNLLENAGKWAEKTVLVRLVASDMPQILVEDDGPGVPENQRARVVGQGVRLDETKNGSGLGLAIVEEIVEAHGGILGLETSFMGGLLIRVRLQNTVSSS